MRNLWLIIGLHDSKWIDNIRNNITRLSNQSDIICKPVIVENGAKWIEGEDIIKSSPGVSNYINAGIAYVKSKAKPGDWLAKIDADDYYGSIRATNIAKAANAGANLVGASSIFCNINNKLFAADFQIPNWTAIPTNIMAHGPTLACRVDICEMFPTPDRGFGEDILWIDKMRSKGIDCYSLPPEGFCWNRYPDNNHAFPIVGEEIIHLWECPTYDLGKFDEEIINGVKKPKQIIPLFLDKNKQTTIINKLLIKNISH